MTPPSSLAALPRAAVPPSSPALPSGEEVRDAATLIAWTKSGIVGRTHGRCAACGATWSYCGQMEANRIEHLHPAGCRPAPPSPKAEATIGNDSPALADAPATLPVPASFFASGPSALPDLTPVVEDAEAAGVVRQPLITEARELLTQAERMWAVDKVIAAQLVADGQDSLQSAIDSLIPPRLRGVKREKPVAAPARRTAE